MTARESAVLRDRVARARVALVLAEGALAHLNPSRRPSPAHSALFGRSFSIGRCQYCGKAARGIACFQHVDLLDLDPKYALAERVAA